MWFFPGQVPIILTNIFQPTMMQCLGRDRVMLCIRFLQIGSGICAVLMADAVATGEVDYLFDSVEFRTPRMGLPGLVLHG